MTQKLMKSIAKAVAPKLKKLSKAQASKKVTEAIVKVVAKEAAAQTPKVEAPKLSVVHIHGKGYSAEKAVMRIRKTLRRSKKHALAEDFLKLVPKVDQLTLTDVLEKAQGFVEVK